MIKLYLLILHYYFTLSLLLLDTITHSIHLLLYIIIYLSITSFYY